MTFKVGDKIELISSPTIAGVIIQADKDGYMVKLFDMSYSYKYIYTNEEAVEHLRLRGVPDTTIVKWLEKICTK